MENKLEERLSSGVFSPEQSAYADEFSKLDEDQINKAIENESDEDKKFDMVMGALKGVQDKGDAEFKKSELQYKENMRKIREGKGTILDVYRQYEKEAIERKDFESANKYRNIIKQVEEAYSLSEMKELLKKKPHICKITEEMLTDEAYRKSLDKVDKRIHKIYNFKFDPMVDIVGHFSRVFCTVFKLDAEKASLLLTFFWKHFNFISVNNNKYFVSKFLFNVKTLAKNENLDEQMEGFKNNLLEVINFVIEMNN